MQKHSRLSEFFKDPRGNFDIFTVISVLAGLALVTAGLIEVWFKHTIQVELIYALMLILFSHAVGDKVVASIMERGVWKPSAMTPDTVINADVKTDSVNVGSDVETQPTDSETQPAPDFYARS